MRAASAFVALLCLAACAAGTPYAHVVHESRRSLPSGWEPVRRAQPSTVLPVRIGLTQPNLDNIEAFLLDVSHPESPNYGKHWSSDKVAQAFRPSDEAVNAVHQWLVDSGIEAHRVKLSSTSSWVTATVTVEEAERLLKTEYHVYQNGEDEHIACAEKYHVPAHVSKHVELITPTLHSNVKTKREPALQKRARVPTDTMVHAEDQPGYGASFPREGGNSKDIDIPADIAHCNEQITLDCLRVLYGYNYTRVSTENNSVAIVEYTPQAYVPADLDLFFNNFSSAQVGQRPFMYSIDGGYLQTNQTGLRYNGESNLDLQYAMGLVGETQTVTLYQAAQDVEYPFDDLLDALDGSYCTYDGGDNSTNGSYSQGTNEECGTITPAYIMSTSYMFEESALTPAFMERQCAEYGKLGLMGVTVMYASGDYGVAGNDDTCLDGNGTSSVNGTGFSPTFPSTCPYVTSVGATQVNPNGLVYEPESACEQQIYSTGGFSNVFAMPSYQKAAVDWYLQNYPPPYPANVYNSSGTSRGFPDMALNGANYVIAIQGEFQTVSGTSCASPAAAAILSGINDARLAAGKSSIGFINPTIYTPEFMAAFNDITNGTNPGCGTNGFSAEPGWDPVTGVGTLNFPKLLDLWLSLP